ncbi:MAG: tRNA pseudouridine synthase A [Chloroflexi bacterium]|nr:tRNA pseudouridine synthase A [Chloroflexota bacterium]
MFAGRTDAGVHSSGQTIAFDLAWNHSEGDLQRALNSHLPRDIALREVKRTGAEFHPRFQAQERCYQYRIYSAPVRDPLRERYAWRIWPPLNVERVEVASQHLLGVHDFAAFGSPHKEGGSTTREIRSVSWQQKEDEYLFEVCGNAFLYHMVRHIVEVLVAIGQEREKTDAIMHYLQNPAGPPAPGLAPPQGLTLKKVVYG